MNIFSNIGITELILILLLALLVVGPERLPEIARGLAKTLRDVRRAYDNLTRDLGPELMSLQESTREIRESMEAVRNIPQDTVKSVIKAADLGDTMDTLRDVKGSFQQVGKTVADAQRVVRNPLKAAAGMTGAALTGAGGAAASESAAPDSGDETVALAGSEPAAAAGVEEGAGPEIPPVAPPVRVDVPTGEPPTEEPADE